MQAKALRSGRLWTALDRRGSGRALRWRLRAGQPGRPAGQRHRPGDAGSARAGHGEALGKGRSQGRADRHRPWHRHRGFSERQGPTRSPPCAGTWKPDGRHAKVGFTDDWLADAARRDLTFNAMSLIAGRQPHRSLSAGPRTWPPGRVRFVGSAEPAHRRGPLAPAPLLSASMPTYGKGEPWTPMRGRRPRDLAPTLQHALHGAGPRRAACASSRPPTP